ncbi:MAG: Histidine ammonia-lyase [Candidatus Roizmanbacteria bacterium GW2011_GWC2_37_13]|uniref:Histidine ammonia-lyase n=1 Tax=Candidatus Roizmanbacteria bacterium GW2011_GWC2_37_13 TaxID=1618486 RepID=A0A0G0G5Y6_9BACT|nr:MAG: Histidine ammonia-lyase [Candidatus Roizmanbacteria bacterium GW2011_GWC1_37_12]KKQ26528.1 MAG: Histidine ammonia-lyase [Candidatus Roizmanbacteria bacterium GW2011_GWC2_37_13]
MKQINEVTITGRDLTIEQIKAVARDYVKLEIGKEAFSKSKQGYNILQEKINKKEKIYGVTTGFGEFSQVFIDPEKAAQLQLNLILSHSTGVGDPASEDVVRATMLCRANYLASGMSGGRPILLQILIEMLNKRVTPLILEQGSVGSSGDLAPLAMMVLPMIGVGEAFYQGKRMSGKLAMEKAGIPLIKLQAKEGLALINGDTFMAGLGSLELYDALQLAKISEISCAMTMEAIEVVLQAMDEKIARARRFNGQITAARNLRKLMNKSEILAGPPQRVQDAYSIRCAPVILGASREALLWVKRQFETEINAAQDNPLVFLETKEVLSGGNFHGQPIAMPLETMAQAIQEYANSSEIRQERMNNPYYSKILPAFLIESGGLNSGFMMPQYASAALVNENKILCYPGIVDSIPVSAGQEDDCSMGTNAALKIQRIIRNTMYVLAIELMLGCQALDFKKGKKPGLGVFVAYKLIRETVPYIKKDSIMYPMVKEIFELIKSEKIVQTVENSIGKLEEPKDLLKPL